MLWLVDVAPSCCRGSVCFCDSTEVEVLQLWNGPEDVRAIGVRAFCWVAMHGEPVEPFQWRKALNVPDVADAVAMEVEC